MALINEKMTRINERMTRINEKMTRINERLTRINDSDFAREMALALQKWGQAAASNKYKINIK